MQMRRAGDEWVCLCLEARVELRHLPTKPGSHWDSTKCQFFKPAAFKSEGCGSSSSFDEINGWLGGLLCSTWSFPATTALKGKKSEFRWLHLPIHPCMKRMSSMNRGGRSKPSSDWTCRPSPHHTLWSDGRTFTERKGLSFYPAAVWQQWITHFTSASLSGRKYSFTSKY